MVTFPERLKELRITHKMRQQDVADAVGITLRGYQFIEKGTKEPMLSNFIAIADAFGVSLDYLAGRTDDSSGGRDYHIPDGSETH